MKIKRLTLVGTGALAGAFLTLMTGAGQAQTSGDTPTIQQLERQIQAAQQNYSSQIQALQQQIDQMKTQQRQQMEQAEVVRQQAADAAKAAAVAPRGPHVVETAGHEFGLESADGQNSIFLTGRIHFDTGGYFNYDRKNGNAPLALSDGENFRRARIGVVGQFAGDWNYGLIYDFGGSSDAIFSSTSPASNNTIASGIENAYIIYNGFYKHGETFPVAFDLGAIDVPWTLDESISSNDIMFIERSSAQVIATSFGGGDSRTAFGVRSNNDRYFLAAYLTGPSTGAFHVYDTGTTPCTVSSTNPDNCDGPQMSFLARGTYQIYQTDEASIHVGVNFADEFRPRSSSNLSQISLSDRPELRIDPTTFLGTGSINASSGMVIGAEAAAAWQNAYIQGEYYHYSINQLTAGFPTLNFDGGYVQASYSFGGRRHYKTGAGSYTGVIPDNQLSFSNGNWGALELAARYSVVDLNSGSGSCTASTPLARGRVCGGDQETYAVGINYYPNDNIRFMLDFEHADISVPLGSTTAKAAEFDDIALRTQINF